jgi:hypothetical protein
MIFFFFTNLINTKQMTYQRHPQITHVAMVLSEHSLAVDTLVSEEKIRKSFEDPCPLVHHSTQSTRRNESDTPKLDSRGCLSCIAKLAHDFSDHESIHRRMTRWTQFIVTNSATIGPVAAGGNQIAVPLIVNTSTVCF